MVAAMMFPESDNKGGRGKTGKESYRFPMVTKVSLSQARKVYRLARDGGGDDVS
jgi:hypothetical protein